MTLASHYIFKDVLNLLDRGRKDRLKEVCDIYRDRYREDEELLAIFGSVLKHIHSEEDIDLNVLKDRISELIASRRMDALGGLRLPKN